jgi:DNA-binding transcriptional LysR family regulator
MIVDQLNLNQLRIFECVYRTRSMTAASQELHLTQSGVSQHIKALEDMLGVPLFDRVKQRLIPTGMGTTLYRSASQGLLEIEQALIEIKGGEKQLAGLVSIGMPTEFGNNVIIPLLARFGQKYPRIRLKVILDFAPVMNEALLTGEVDFAFVDDFAMDRAIEREKVYDETIELCILEDLLKRNKTPRSSKKIFDTLEYIDYGEGEPVLRMWFHHHLGKRNQNLDVRATVKDVHSVARFIVNGMGAGPLPGHLISKLETEGYKLFCFKGCGKPLVNEISVAHVPTRSHSLASSSALDWLKVALKERRKGIQAEA